jgi:hypothetical protein
LKFSFSGLCKYLLKFVIQLIQGRGKYPIEADLSTNELPEIPDYTNLTFSEEKTVEVDDFLVESSSDTSETDHSDGISDDEELEEGTDDPDFGEELPSNKKSSKSRGAAFKRVRNKDDILSLLDSYYVSFPKFQFEGVYTISFPNGIVDLQNLTASESSAIIFKLPYFLLDSRLFSDD